MKILPTSLIRSLETAHSLYSSLEFLQTDPIAIPKLFHKKEDIELISLLACLFAYGNVKAIKNFVTDSIRFLGKEPYDSFLTQNENFKEQLANLSYYRFQTKSDVQVLYLTLSQWIRKRSVNRNLESGIWEGVFLSDSGTFDPIRGIQNFQNEFLTEIQSTAPLTRGLMFLIGDPKSSSPRKRLCLFLRWMVRKDFPDFGIYRSITAKHLTFPLDVHIQRISKILGLTTSKSFRWKDSIALRDIFLTQYPEDPLRFDFILTRVGMIQKCQGKLVKEICGKCELRKDCRIGSATGN